MPVYNEIFATPAGLYKPELVPSRPIPDLTDLSSVISKSLQSRKFVTTLLQLSPKTSSEHHQSNETE